MTQRNTYTFSITVPKNTTIETLILGGQNVGVLHGKLISLNIDIPNGVAFTAGIRIDFQKSFSIPSQVKGGERYISGNNNLLKLEPGIDIYEKIPEFYGINNDAVNDHTFFVTMEIEQ